jgi:hypothetical protein
MELTLQNLNKEASTNGVIVGILSVVIGIVVYYAAPSLLGSIGFGIASGVISLLIYIFFTIDLRKKIGGFWSFREALKGIFLMAFVAGLLYSVVNFAFYKFIEPNAFETVASYMEKGTSDTFEKMGMDQDSIDEAISGQMEAVKEQYNPTLAQFFKNLGIAVIVQFVMSLIFAAIFKKEEPIFASAIEEEQE